MFKARRLVPKKSHECPKLAPNLPTFNSALWLESNIQEQTPVTSQKLKFGVESILNTIGQQTQSSPNGMNGGF